MKTKLIAAAAALLACSAAQAQTSVTLYGVADIGLEYLTKAEGTKDNLVRMSSGNLSGSRWGLRGSEDLGGGLKSVFVLESGFQLDTGDNNRLFGRQAYLGLQTKAGTVTLGRQQNLLYDFTVNYDPMGAATRYSLANMDGEMVSRADNAIKYVGTFGGLTASALYSFGYGGEGSARVFPYGLVYGPTNVEGEVPGKWRQGREMSAGLSYAAGQFGVSTVYDHRNPIDSIKEQRATIAGTYTVGPAKLYGGYRWASLNGGANSARSNLWWLGAGYNVTSALSLSGAAYYQDLRSTKADPWLFVLQADYALSKRTDVYLSMAYALNRTDNNLYWTDSGRNVSSNLRLDDGMKWWNGLTDSKQNQFGAVVGIRHRF